MIKSEYKITTVWGIPIKIHISMLLFLAYIAFSEATGDNGNRGLLNSLIAIGSVLIGGILIFASIALHELGHSFVAIRKGCRVYEITLMFMGGAAKMDKMPSRPRDEFLMAIAGPAVSLLLGIIGIGIGIPLYFHSGGILQYIGMTFLVVGIVNMILAVFNLVPAFPMDGGRVFRALLTPRYGRVTATYIASRLGRAIAVAFFIIGIFGLKNANILGLELFRPWNPFLIVISIFIFTTADREFRMVQYEELMKNRNTGGNIWSSIFGNAQPPRQQPPPMPSEPMDDSVHISPPPYAKGPDAHTNLHQTKEPKNPLKSFFGR